MGIFRRRSTGDSETSRLEAALWNLYGDAWGVLLDALDFPREIPASQLRVVILGEDGKGGVEPKGNAVAYLSSKRLFFRRGHLPAVSDDAEFILPLAHICGFVHPARTAPNRARDGAVVGILVGDEEAPTSYHLSRPSSVTAAEFQEFVDALKECAVAVYRDAAAERSMADYQKVMRQQGDGKSVWDSYGK